MMPKRLVSLFFALLVCLPPTIRAQSQAEYWDHFVRFEGYRLTRYKIHGSYHIGVGHKLAPSDDLRQITPEIARDLFTCDLAQAVRISMREVPSFDEHSVEVRMVIVDLAFNVGERGLRDFVRFRQCLDKHDYFGAARELIQSRRSQQVGKARTEWAIKALTHAAVWIK